MKEEQQPEPDPEAKSLPQDPNVFAEGFEAKESRRKRQTIRIKIPRKPAAPRKVARTASLGVPVLNPVQPARVNDLPLRIVSFVIVTLLALVYCHFFFEFIRLLPLKDFLPMILWPQVVHKLLGAALLVGFALFETTRKGLSPRSRWAYCIVLAFGVALFVVQWIIRW